MHDLLTSRLSLRPLALSDGDKLHQLWTQPAVRRFLWDDRVIPPAQTRDIIRRSGALFAEKGFGLWGLFPVLAPSGLLGFGGYWYFRDPPDLELIIGLAPDRWGQGLASEAGQTLLAHAFDRLLFTRVQGSTDTANLPSVRLMDRLGMQFIKRAVLDGLDTVFYEITMENWRAKS